MRAAFDGGRLTSDAGVLMLADIERRLGMAERLARCLNPDPQRFSAPSIRSPCSTKSVRSRSQAANPSEIAAC